MNRRVYPAILVLLMLAMITGSTQAVPRLVMDETQFDFGYVPQHAKVTHVFWLKSVGDDSLKILKVTPGCGCTKAPLEKSNIAPGDSAKLEIIFSTKKYKNRVSKSPRILTNEGNAENNIRISTHVVTQPDSTYPVVISPYKLDLSQFTEKVRDKIYFEINNVSDQELKITLIDYPDELFDIDLPKKIKAGQTGKGVLQLNNNALKESFEKSFTIELNDERHSRFTIPVKRVVRAPGKPSASVGM